MGQKQQVPSCVEGLNSNVFNPGFWDIERIDPDHPASLWSDTLSSHTAHHWRVDPSARGNFQGYSCFRSVRDSRIVSFGGQERLRFERDRKDVQRTTRQDLSIVFAAEGDMELTVGNRRAALKQGSFTITDSACPMTFETTDRFRQFDLIFPKNLLLAKFPFAEEFVGMTLGPGEGLLAFFVDHLFSVEEHLRGIEDRLADNILMTTLDLLAMTLSSLDAGRLYTPRERTLHRIKQFIETRLTCEELDPDMIAHANGITTRYLHKLFAETGTTVGTWVRRRLENCCRDLLSNALSKRSITEIAMRWGFNDMSYFSKTFKRQFGVSPSDMRRRT